MSKYCARLSKAYIARCITQESVLHRAPGYISCYTLEWVLCRAQDRALPATRRQGSSLNTTQYRALSSTPQIQSSSIS